MPPPPPPPRPTPPTPTTPTTPTQQGNTGQQQLPWQQPLLDVLAQLRARLNAANPFAGQTATPGQPGQPAALNLGQIAGQAVAAAVRAAQAALAGTSAAAQGVGQTVAQSAQSAGLAGAQAAMTAAARAASAAAAGLASATAATRAFGQAAQHAASAAQQAAQSLGQTVARTSRRAAGAVGSGARRATAAAGAGINLALGNTAAAAQAVGQALQAAGQSIGQWLQPLAQSAQRATQALAGMAQQASQGIGQALQGIGQALQGALQSATGAVTRFGQSLARMPVIQAIGQRASQAARAVGRAVGATGRAVRSVGQVAATGAVRSLGVAGSIIGGLLGRRRPSDDDEDEDEKDKKKDKRPGALSVIADSAGAVVAAFQQITATAGGFVQALNPSAMLVFNQAMRDLQATIGVALQPVIQAATEVLRDLAATLLPAMQRLAPVVANVANAFGSIAGAGINALGSVLRSLQPIFEALGEAVKAVVPVVQTYIAAFLGVANVMAGVGRRILSAFGIDVSGSIQSFSQALRDLTKNTLLATAAFVKFISPAMGKNFLEGALAAFQGDKQSAVGLATPMNPQVGDLKSFNRTVLQASLLAGPGGVQSKDEKEEAWRKEIITQLKAMLDGQGKYDKALDEFKKYIGDKIDTIGEKIVGAVGKGVFDRGKDALGYLFDPFSPRETIKKLEE